VKNFDVNAERVPQPETHPLPAYGLAIANALADGYRVDADSGVIYGRKGRPLSVRRYGAQRYPMVSLAVSGMPRRSYVVPAYKVVAYAVWGPAAFAPGVCVYHGSRGVDDVSLANLAIGSHSDKELAKAPEVRQHSAKRARAAQGIRGLSLFKVDDASLQKIMDERIFYSINGRVRRGLLAELAREHGVSKSCMSAAIRNFIRRRKKS